MWTINGRIRVTVNVVNIPLHVFLQEADADPQWSYPCDSERRRQGCLPGHRTQLPHREERRRETCAEARATAQPRDGENAAEGKDDVPQSLWSVRGDASSSSLPSPLGSLLRWAAFRPLLKMDITSRLLFRGI